MDIGGYENRATNHITDCQKAKKRMYSDVRKKSNQFLKQYNYVNKTISFLDMRRVDDKASKQKSLWCNKNRKVKSSPPNINARDTKRLSIRTPKKKNEWKRSQMEHKPRIDDRSSFGFLSPLSDITIKVWIPWNIEWYNSFAGKKSIEGTQLVHKKKNCEVDILGNHIYMVNKVALVHCARL